MLLEKQAEFEINNNLNSNYYFQEHLYVFQYQGKIRQILLDYKFNNQAYLYKTITI